MSDGHRSNLNEAVLDVGEFCREVESFLSRVNDGHLVRIVGTGFELVRGWAREGIPLSIVCHGIELKAERHRNGRATRPLRIEFCEADVRAVYDGWRRAVGFSSGPGVGDGAPDGPPTEERRRPSLTKHLDRAIDRLSRVAGRLDLSAEFLDVINRVLQDVVAVRDGLAHARGVARDDLAARLPAFDRALVVAADRAIDSGERDRLRAGAEADLAVYRGRLDADAWQRSVDIGVAKLLRDRFGLPSIEPGI